MTKVGPTPLQVQHYMCTEETHKKPDGCTFCRINPWHLCLKDEVSHDPAIRPSMCVCHCHRTTTSYDLLSYVWAQTRRTNT